MGKAAAAVGLACGLMLGQASQRWLAPLAPGTRVGDWWPLQAAFVALLLVAAAPMVAPAAKAAGVDALRSIRHIE